jgi:hypothetical protein
MLGPADARRVIDAVLATSPDGAPVRDGDRMAEVIRLRDDLDLIEGAWTGVPLVASGVAVVTVAGGVMGGGVLLLAERPLLGSMGILWGAFLFAWGAWVFRTERRRATASRVLEGRLGTLLEGSTGSAEASLPLA